jgi:Virulence-associated protein E
MSDEVVSASATAQPREFTATVTTSPESDAKPTAAPELIEMSAGGDAAGDVALTIRPEDGTMPAAARGGSGITATVTGPGQGRAADPSRQFMNCVVPWPGPQSPGWINLHTHLKNPDPNRNGGKPFVVGWPVDNVDDFLRRAKAVNNSSVLHDAWFCTSQQRERGATAKGTPKAIRRATNTTFVKSVWADIDIKPGDTTGKHYTSVLKALAAIRKFRKKTGLPTPSAVVKSGGGLHVYWISEVPLTPDEWRPYAEGLKALLNRESVKCDVGLTTDIVRLLRVPETLNHKYSPPRRVKLVHLGQMYNFASALAALLGAAPTTSAVSPSWVPVIEPGYESAFENGPDPAFASLSPADDLAQGIQRYSRLPLDPGPIFEKCMFMRHAKDTGGADYDNSLWMYSVLCATYLKDGNEIAHEISGGYSSYTQAETQAMYERKLADRETLGIGWPSCTTIQGAGCKSCATCPFLSRGKTPLHLTEPFTATVNPVSSTAPATVAPAGQTPGWPDGCNRQGVPVRGYANTLTAIRKLKINCKFDTFRQKEFSEGHAIPSLDGELSDGVVTMLGDRISSTYGFYPGKEPLREALTAECLRNAFNPVTDYFNNLKWDSVPRLSKLMHRYFQADDTSLNDAISMKLLCAIVRRSKHPGCKYDHEVVLQGDQGARKSMFCEDLAVFPDLFTDAGDLAGSIKEQMEIAQGKQIIEFAELAGFSQNSRERNKAYLSRRVDRARLAYGHYAKDQPRSSVPIGTTNPGGYLNDPTGERRYWHVAVRKYDRDAFLADKDQLYAEAVVLEPNARLWLDTSELKAAHDAIVATAKEPNTLVDDLHDLVGEIWVADRTKSDGGWLIHQEERVSNCEVRAKAGLTGVNVHSMRDLGKRMSEAMTSLGWKKAAGTLVCKHGGSAEGGYRRPTKDRFEPDAAAPEESTESPAVDMKQDTQ